MTEPIVAKGLLAVWFDIPLELEEEFNDWHGTEHLPEREALPGFLSARRFVNMAEGPRYLALYDLESVAVLQSPAYLRLVGDNESPWTRRIRRKANRIVRNVYEEVRPLSPSEHGKAILSQESDQSIVILVQPTTSVALGSAPETRPPGSREPGSGDRFRLVGTRSFTAIEGEPDKLVICELQAVLEMEKLRSHETFALERGELLSFLGVPSPEPVQGIYLQVYPIQVSSIPLISSH